MKELDDEKIVRKIIEFFPDLGDLKKIMKIRKGTASQNFIIVTNRGEFFLRRRNPKYSEENEILFDHSLIKHLTRKGIIVPRLLESFEGKTWIRLNGYIYEIYEYIHGRPFNEKISDLKIAAKELAKYHLAVKDFTPEGSKPRAELREDHPTLIRPIIEEMLRKANSSYSHVLIYLTEQLNQVQSELSEKTYHSLPHLIIHGDFHPANIMFLGNKRICFTDFDWASMQARIVDIADGIIFFASKRETDINGGDIVSLTQPFKIDVRKSKIFIESYNDIYEIKEEEIYALPSLIKSRWIGCRAKGALKLPENIQLQYLVSNVEKPLIWLDKWKNLFVRELKSIL